MTRKLPTRSDEPHATPEAWTYIEKQQQSRSGVASLRTSARHFAEKLRLLFELVLQAGICTDLVTDHLRFSSYIILSAIRCSSPSFVARSG